MQQRDAVSWARLGLIEKAFLISIALFALVYFTGVLSSLQGPLALITVALAVATLVQLARYSFRNVIWRLRNRLIVAYLFIAVVPVVLILILIAGTAYLVVGQMAIYLINTELNNHMRVLTFPANAMVRNPMRDPQATSNQVLSAVRRYFPEFELLTTGESPMRLPPGSTLEAPPRPGRLRRVGRMPTGWS